MHAGIQNQTAFADTPLSPLRSYLYQTCLELGAYSRGSSLHFRHIGLHSFQKAEAAPFPRRSLLSRVVQPDYSQRWCGWSFPPGKVSSIPVGAPDLQRVNKYGALTIQADRLAQVDGGQDPWLYK